MKISAQHQNALGLNYCFNQLNFISPLGEGATLSPFDRARYAQLCTRLDDVQGVLGALNANSDILQEICRILATARRINKTIDKLGATLDMLELFELKHFALLVSQLEPLLNRFCVDFALRGAYSHLADLNKPLDLLDGDGKRSDTFYLTDDSDSRLTSLRDQKRAIEVKLRALKGKNANTTAQKEQYYNQLATISAQEKLIEGEVMRRLSLQLQPHKQAFAQCHEALTEFDVVYAIANLARRFNCVKPTLAEGGIRATELRLPQLQAVLDQRGEEFAPLDIELTQGATVLTGANMGGKTVALKALLLNCALAHYGFFVFARQLCLPMFDEIILVTDEKQGASLSSFAAEVMSLSDAVTAAKQGTVLLGADEFARGTNATEGQQIFAAALRALNALNCYALLTTHYDGVAEYAVAHYQTKGLNLPLSQEGVCTPEKLRQYMDYGLIKVSAHTVAPKDAINICRLLTIAQELKGEL